MAELTPTIGYQGEFAGHKQIIGFTAVPTTASDTVDLSSYCSSIDSIVASISSGLDAALTMVQPSVSGTTVTLATFEQDGTAATDLTNAEISCQAIVTL